MPQTYHGIDHTESVSGTQSIRNKVCSYLKIKIAGEERETRNYNQLEKDVIKLTHNYSLDYLLNSQKDELEALKELYMDLCVRGQK